MNIIITSQSATVIVEGKPYTVAKEHKRFKELIAAYKTGDVKRVKAVIDKLNEIREWGNDKNVKVIGGVVYYKGEHMENAITNRIADWIGHDLDPQPMINFLERILANPSYQSREELLLFLEHNNLPIQEDGSFLAYKVVRKDYLDKHSGTFDNSVGQTVEMDRGEVDDRRQNTCSAGLHFCSREYIPHFSHGESRLMLLSIDPADVVSIPNDYNNSKGRCCRYKVIDEVTETQEFNSPLHTGKYTIQVVTDMFKFVWETDDWGDETFTTHDCLDEPIVFTTMQAAREFFDNVDKEFLYDDGFELDYDEEVSIQIVDENDQVVVAKVITN